MVSLRLGACATWQRQGIAWAVPPSPYLQDADHSRMNRCVPTGVWSAWKGLRRSGLKAALGRAVKLLAFGSSVGLFLGFLASRVLAAIVYQAAPRDPGLGGRCDGRMDLFHPCPFLDECVKWSSILLFNDGTKGNTQVSGTARVVQRIPGLRATWRWSAHEKTSSSVSLRIVDQFKGRHPVDTTKEQ